MTAVASWFGYEYFKQWQQKEEARKQQETLNSCVSIINNSLIQTGQGVIQNGFIAVPSKLEDKDVHLIMKVISVE